MNAYASSPKTPRESSPEGALILKIKNGALRAYAVGNSDEEVADVLKAFRDALITGALAELAGL